MNNNKTDENAILGRCNGVFAKSSYITFGSKEVPEPYGAKPIDRPNFKGKQLATAPPKEGTTNDAFFEKKHNWISDTQKQKKKGFLTGDFNRKDEFSNTIRTEQYREQLKKEIFTSSKAKQKIDKNSLGQENSALIQKQQQKKVKPFLYDLVFEKSDQNFNGSSKTHKDTRNPTALTKERRLGVYQTTSILSYAPPTEFPKPDFARKPIVRDSFYRKACVLYPDGCAITAGQE